MKPSTEKFAATVMNLVIDITTLVFCTLAATQGFLALGNLPIPGVI